MKGKIDTFDAWFEAQHGGRTDSGMVGHTDRDLRDIIYYAKDAKHVIAPRQLWDEQRKAALYAWNARGLRK